MKKLLFAVSALAALSLLAPSSGFAQHVYFNQVGLYTTSNALPAMPGDNITGTDVVGDPVTVFLVLTRPAEGEAVFGGVRAFEVQLNFNPVGNLFMLSGVLGAPGLNIGDIDHISLGYLEYIVGFGSVLPLTADESVVLVTFSFLNSNSVPVEVTLSPPSEPSIPGEMVYSPDDPPVLRPMYSSGGDTENPVFTFGGSAVAVENESFGAVKALYR